MDPDDYLRASEIIVEPALIEEDKPKLGISNFARLGYREIIYQKESQILVADLREGHKIYSPNIFNSIRQIYEKGIKKFKMANSIQESSSLMINKRRRGYSVDSQSIGTFYLNNWISGEQYPCEKPSPEQKTVHLVYEILASEWSKALDIVNTLPPSLQLNTLSFVLKGFKSIQIIIAQENQYFESQFLNRDRFEITCRSSADNLGTTGSFISIFDEESRPKFSEIKSIHRKVDCLKANLQFLVTFASRYRVTQSDDYVKLAFYLLSNSVNQQQQVDDVSLDFAEILLSLNLKIYDRLNFATKLLTQKKRKQFCLDLQNSLSNFPCLDNILFFLGSNNGKGKEDKIKDICRAYLDEYGDLETVAYLSLQLPFLDNYYKEYRQILELADQVKQIQKIEYCRWGNRGQQRKQMFENKKYKKNMSFFQSINIPEQKIVEIKIHKDNFNICQICSKKIHKNQNFLQCGKCHHGGHATHLLKWFEESENCPHIGCPCVCN